MNIKSRTFVVLRIHHRYDVISRGQNVDFSLEIMNALKETTNKIVTDSKRDSESKTEFQLIIWGVVINEEKRTINRIRVFPINWEWICRNMMMAAKNEIINWKKTLATSDAKSK